MRILQVTNIVSHHQLPLARNLALQLGKDNFRFAALEPLDHERIQMGWSSAATEPWILRVAESDAHKSTYESWWNDADIVLCGERKFHGMEQRLKNGKACLYMSERWWKPPIGMFRLMSPKFLRMSIHLRKIASNPLFHYLAIGPFAAQDFSKFIEMDSRIWKWGYFTSEINKQREYVSPSLSTRILWVGRMVDWKRVDTLIKAVAALLDDGVAVNLTLVGDGPARKRLEQLAMKLLLSENYKFENYKSPEKIPEIMLNHDIYVLASNAYEGWGAVVNEAMACEMAVVGSIDAGAARSLIEQNIDGLLFKPGDWRELASKISILASNPHYRVLLGKAARKKICDLWSPDIAAKRLVEFSYSILTHRTFTDYIQGPLSPAKAWVSG